MNEKQLPNIDPKIVLEDFYKVLQQVANPKDWHQKVEIGYEVIKKALEKNE